jgi:hypothetical protein
MSGMDGILAGKDGEEVTEHGTCVQCGATFALHRGGLVPWHRGRPGVPECRGSGVLAVEQGGTLEDSLWPEGRAVPLPSSKAGIAAHLDGSTHGRKIVWRVGAASREQEFWEHYRTHHEQGSHSAPKDGHCHDWSRWDGPGSEPR